MVVADPDRDRHRDMGLWDLLFPEPPDDAEEQTAIIWCGFGVKRDGDSCNVLHGFAQASGENLLIS
jgi:hypothetical protein